MSVPKKKVYHEEWTDKERQSIDAYLYKIQEAQKTERKGAYLKFEVAFEMEQKVWTSLSVKMGDFANWLQNATGIPARTYIQFRAARQVLNRDLCETLGASGTAEIGRLMRNPSIMHKVAVAAVDELRRVEAESAKVLGPGIAVATIHRICKDHGIEVPKKNSRQIHMDAAPFIEIIRGVIAMMDGDPAARAYMMYLRRELEKLGVAWQVAPVQKAA